MNQNQTPQGTSFPVATNSDLFPVVVVGLGEEPRPREKAAPTGETTYATGAVLMTLTKEGVAKANKSASIHVINPAAKYEVGVKYFAQGRVYVQPYESNARVTYSITCERLVPESELRQAAPAQPQPQPRPEAKA